MNEYEKKFLAWLEKEKQEEQLRAVRYAQVHGDTGLANKYFFKKTRAINEAEFFPRIKLEIIWK
jgi:hypothetical protein